MRTFIFCFNCIPWPFFRLLAHLKSHFHKTTPVQRYVGSLLHDIATSQSQQTTLASNTPLPIPNHYPAPAPNFKNVIAEIKRISQYEHSITNGIFNGSTDISIRLDNAENLTDFTLRTSVFTHDRITTLHIALLPIKKPQAGKPPAHGS